MKYILVLLFICEVLFLCSGCAHVKMQKIENVMGKAGTVSFNYDSRQKAKLEKADKKIAKFCAPASYKLVGKPDFWQHFDSGMSFTTRRGVTVNMPASLENWVTYHFECSDNKPETSLEEIRANIRKEKGADFHFNGPQPQLTGAN